LANTYVCQVMSRLPSRQNRPGILQPMSRAHKRSEHQLEQDAASSGWLLHRYFSNCDEAKPDAATLVCADPG